MNSCAQYAEKWQKRNIFFWFVGVSFFAFMVSFYTPISSKGSNNIFYACVGFPSFIWWLKRFRVAKYTFSIEPRVFLLAAMLITWLSFRSLSFLLDSFYIFGLFLACVMLEYGPCRISKIFTVFSLVSAILLIYAASVWLLGYYHHGGWERVQLWGQTGNPIAAGLMLTSALVFIWLFIAEPWLQQKSVYAERLGLLLLCILAGLCATILQSRSALLGFLIFLGCYAIKRRIVLIVLMAVSIILFIASITEFGEIMMQRKESFRFSIWRDAVQRLFSVCNIFLGCGKDGHLFAGAFPHGRSPHSGYVSLLYYGGIGAAVLYLAMIANLVFKAKESRWLLLAMVGWGGLITDSNGFFESPRSLWVYFWVPTLMALLDCNRSALEDYYKRRDVTTC